MKQQRNSSASGRTAPTMNESTETLETETGAIPVTRVTAENFNETVTAEKERQGRPPEVEPATETEDEGGKANREAAKYRTRLRETEAQRDTLTARIEAFQKADALRHAGTQLADPEDLFTVGQVKLADLLDDDGNVVPELVETALMGILETRPGLGKAATPRGPSAAGAGNRASYAGSGTSWGSVLRGGR